MALDKETLKQATAGRAPSRKSGRAAQATQVGDALGAEATLTLQGRGFTPGALTFGDLKRIESRFGNLDSFLEQVGQFRLDALGFLIWLSLRKSDPGLTEADLDELLPVRQDDLLAALNRVLAVSGLVETDAGNEEAPASP